LGEWVRALRYSSIASSRRLIKASSTEITSSSAEMPLASSQFRRNSSAPRTSKPCPSSLARVGSRRSLALSTTPLRPQVRWRYDLSIKPANIALALKSLWEMHGPTREACSGWRSQSAGFARARRCRPLSAYQLSGNSWCTEVAET